MSENEKQERQFTWDQRMKAREVAREKFSKGEYDLDYNHILLKVNEEAEKKDWDFEISIRAKSGSGYYLGKAASLTFSGNKDIASHMLIGINTGTLRNLIALASENHIRELAEDQILEKAAKVELPRLFPESEDNPGMEVENAVHS